MTPDQFELAIMKACAAQTRTEVAAAGFAAVREALGANAVEYVAGIDHLCRRLRQLQPRPQFGPPRAETVGKPVDAKGAVL